MGTVTLDQTLEMAMQLSPEQQQMLVDILTRREIETWRQEAARDARADIEAFHRGELKPEPVQDIIARLRADLEAEAE